MNLKNVLVLLFLLLLNVLNAQEIHPNFVRKAIYDSIIKDINSNKKSYIIKEIYVDATVNKFDDIEMNTYGVQLSDPEYINDDEFCKVLTNVKCVKKIEIDQFSLNKIYQEHNDKEHMDFYGVYAPLDHWYNVIHNTFQYYLQQEKPQYSSVIIPVKNVFFKDAKVITDYFFYQFNLDKDFKITSFQKIKF